MFFTFTLLFTFRDFQNSFGWWLNWTYFVFVFVNGGIEEGYWKSSVKNWGRVDMAPMYWLKPKYCSLSTKLITIFVRDFQVSSFKLKLCILPSFNKTRIQTWRFLVKLSTNISCAQHSSRTYSWRNISFLFLWLQKIFKPLKELCLILFSRFSHIHCYRLFYDFIRTNYWKIFILYTFLR